MEICSNHLKKSLFYCEDVLSDFFYPEEIAILLQPGNLLHSWQPYQLKSNISGNCVRVDYENDNIYIRKFFYSDNKPTLKTINDDFPFTHIIIKNIRLKPELQFYYFNHNKTIQFENDSFFIKKITSQLIDKNNYNVTFFSNAKNIICKVYHNKFKTKVQSFDDNNEKIELNGIHQLIKLHYGDTFYEHMFYDNLGLVIPSKYWNRFNKDGSYTTYITNIENKHILHYNSDKNLLFEEWLDTCDNAFKRLQYYYNESKLNSEIYVEDLINKNNIKYQYCYNSIGDKIKIKTLDSRNKPINIDGLAIHNISYDSVGNVIKKSFFNNDSIPTYINQAKIIKLKRNDKGDFIELEKYKENNELDDAFGYTSFIKTKDKHNKLWKKTYYSSKIELKQKPGVITDFEEKYDSPINICAYYKNKISFSGSFGYSIKTLQEEVDFLHGLLSLTKKYDQGFDISGFAPKVDEIAIVIDLEQLMNLKNSPQSSKYYHEIIAFINELINKEIIQYLSLYGNDANAIPELFNYQKLKGISLSNFNNLYKIPKEILEIPYLKKFSLKKSNIHHIGEFSSDSICFIELSELPFIKEMPVLKQNSRLKEIYLENLEIQHLYKWVNCHRELQILTLRKVKSSENFNISNLRELTACDLNNCLINNYSFINQEKLKYLRINYCGLNSIAFDNCKNLKGIDLSNNQIENINLKNQPNIENLKLNKNKISDLTIPKSNFLYYLDASNNDIKNIDAIPYSCPNLEWLDLSYNNINQLPSNFNQLLMLREVNLSYNQISNIEQIDAKQSKLIKINASNNKIKSINSQIFSLKNLEELFLDNNLITEIKIDLNMCDNKITHLVLNNNHIQNFFITNISLEKSVLENIQVLDLSHNKLSCIDDISKINYQRKSEGSLILSYNQIENIPPFISNSIFYEISLDNNKINRLPKEFNNFQSEKKVLYLNNNHIKTIPIELLNDRNFHFFLNENPVSDMLNRDSLFNFAKENIVKKNNCYNRFYATSYSESIHPHVTSAEINKELSSYNYSIIQSLNDYYQINKNKKSQMLKKNIIIFLILLSIIVLIALIIVKLKQKQKEKIHYYEQLNLNQQIELEKERLENEKKQFQIRNIAGLCHDLKAPTGIIKSSSTMINTELKGFINQSKDILNDQIQFMEETTNQIYANAASIQKLIQTFEKIEKDSIRNDFRELYLSEFIEDLKILHRNQLNQKKIEVILDNDISFYSYSGIMVQIIANLFQNTLDHAIFNETRKIIINGTTNENEIIITYFDSGSPISSQVANRIWEPYFSTRKDGIRGNGLTLVKNYVENVLNGKILLKVDTQAGNLFCIMLPK